MSITNDIRSYADTAVSQGKQVLEQAQAQLNDVTGQANDYVGKFSANATENASNIADKAVEAVNDLRASAERVVNLDAIKSAVEPYLAQVKGYTTTVTDRAESLVAGVTHDKRVAKLVDTAGSVTGVVVETVQQRVVKPVQELTGLGAKPAAKPATRPAKAGAAKPAGKPATSKPAGKPGARKAPAKRTTKS